MSQAMTEVELPEGTDAEALEAAAGAVRRLISHLRKTKAPNELLENAAAQINAIADQFVGHDHPGPYMQGGLVMKNEMSRPGTRTPAEFFPYSPIVGRCNPIAPPVEFRVEGREIHAEHAFDAPYNGPPASVHGGVIAAVFDELLGSNGAMLEIGGFTGTLTIRYRSLTPIGQPIRMRSWIDRQEGRKIFICGTMHFGDTLCSEAEGVFIQPKKSVIAGVIANHGAQESGA
jgi:acyl-coenzyme A thioesterase PaaI-like protein